MLPASSLSPVDTLPLLLDTPGMKRRARCPKIASGVVSLPNHGRAGGPPTGATRSRRSPTPSSWSRPSAATWRRLPFAFLVLSLLSLPHPALAQSGLNVLVVVNDRLPDSGRIAEHYARTRGIAGEQILHVQVEPADEIERAVFDQQIHVPIARWLGEHAAQDRILYIVLAKGIPLRVRGTAGRNGTQASVDSELALLYRRLTGANPAVTGPLPNPYYLGEAAVAEARPFTHDVADLYLVTRLDGFTAADVLALIDRAAAPVRSGRILLDQRASLTDPGGNRWLQQAADWLRGNGLGERVELETTSRVLRDQADVLGYYSWGSNDPANTERRLGLRFVPGALAGLFVSTDGRTFREPPADWKSGPWTDRARFFGGAPQSLAGDLVREGVTGVAAHVAEPYLDATIRPNVLFPAYVSGFNLAESFYLAMPYVSWQTVVVGDPLCAPFPRKVLQPSEIDKGLDPATELPAIFSGRRLKVIESQGVTPEAARAFLRAQARGARGDKAGARKALEETVAADPRLRTAQLQLASEYELAKEHDLALERYRALIALNPKDAIALNNLAYGLAVHKQQAGEALPHAERAYALAPNSPAVVDTLGWIQHLQGRHAEASTLLAQAVRLAPTNAEIRLHAAVAYAANGMLEAAKKELEEALRLDPELAKRDEVQAVRAVVREG